MLNDLRKRLNECVAKLLATNAAKLLGLAAVNISNMHLLVCQTLKDAKGMRVSRKKVHL